MRPSLAVLQHLLSAVGQGNIASGVLGFPATDANVAEPSAVHRLQVDIIPFEGSMTLRHVAPYQDREWRTLAAVERLPPNRFVLEHGSKQTPDCALPEASGFEVRGQSDAIPGPIEEAFAVWPERG